MLKVTRTSTLSGKTRTKQLPITKEQLAAYEAGVYSRVAFPDASDGDIYFLTYGITKEERETYQERKQGPGCGACG